MLSVDTRVFHSVHKLGTVVGRNEDSLVITMLMQGKQTTPPNIIKFDNGHKDILHDKEVEVRRAA